MSHSGNPWIKAAFLFLVSCGAGSLAPLTPVTKHPEWPVPGRSPQVVRILARTPQILRRADPTCTLEQAVPQLGKVKIWLTDSQGQAQLEEVDLSGLSGRGLASAGSHGVTTGFSLVAEYRGCVDRAKDTYRCSRIKTVLVQRGELLPICRPQGEYPRNSVENAALAVAAGVHEGGQFFASLLRKPAAIAPLRLLLFPHIEKRVYTAEGMKTLIETDNAFWTARQNELGGPAIAVLPHSEEMRNFYAARPLWEQRTVLNHEYGHHVFHYMAPHVLGIGQGQGLGLSKESAQHSAVMLQEQQYSPSLAAETGQSKAVRVQRDLGQKDVVSAVNEAFADLFAFYSRGASAGSAMLVGQRTKARNVAIAHQDDGESKALDARVLKHFFRNYVSQPFYALSADHQDVHTVGAIMAHGLDAYWQAGRNWGTQARAGLLLRWAIALEEASKAGHFEGMTVQELLPALLHAGLELGAEQQSFASQQCMVLKRVFPLYVGKWPSTQRCR